MINLGKKLLLLILGLNLYANMFSSGVNKDYVARGDSVAFHIRVSSSNIKIPAITTLCGYLVNGTSMQTSISDINGNYQQSKTYIYSFNPQKSCIIKAIALSINGKILQTKPIKITVHKLVANSNNDFSVNYTISKKILYTAEPFILTLKTKLRRGLDVVNSNFIPSDLKNNFWILKKKQIKTYINGDYIDGGVIYLLSARKSGLVTIAPAKISLATQNNNFNSFFPTQLNWKQYISNALHVNINPLPQGVNLAGDMKLSISVNKLKVLANTPVNATIKISGKGDLTQVPSFKLNIPKIAIFSKNAKVTYNLTPSGYQEVYTKKITFVADNNFTIPSLKLKYFNTNSKNVVTLKTKPIKITVVGGFVAIHKKLQVISAPKTTKMVKQTSQTSYFYLIVAFIVGLIVGSLSIFLLSLRGKKTKEKNVSLNDTRAIITKLIKYKDDKEVSQMIDELEKKLYTSQDIIIDMKKLKALKKRYKF